MSLSSRLRSLISSRFTSCKPKPWPVQRFSNRPVLEPLEPRRLLSLSYPPMSKLHWSTSALTSTSTAFGPRRMSGMG